MSKEYTYEEVVQRIHKNALTGMEKACTVLEADTKLLTHVQTGNLRRSWSHQVETEDGAIVGKVGTNVSYAPVENWRHPNISQAVANDQNQLIAIIQASLIDFG